MKHILYMVAWNMWSEWRNREWLFRLPNSVRTESSFLLSACVIRQ